MIPLVHGHSGELFFSRCVAMIQRIRSYVYMILALVAVRSGRQTCANLDQAAITGMSGPT